MIPPAAVDRTSRVVVSGKKESLFWKKNDEVWLVVVRVIVVPFLCGFCSEFYVGCFSGSGHVYLWGMISESE